MVDSTRLYGLDALRGVAMLMGILLHGSIAYEAGVRFVDWIDDPFDSFFFDWLYLLINSFRMQLFFLLAGFFSHLVVLRKGVTYFAKNRFQRIVIPFVLSYFIILPLTLAPYLYYQYSLSGSDPGIQLKEFLVRFFRFENRSGVMHLWFLYYLILFYIVVFVAQAIQKRMPGFIKSWDGIKKPFVALVASIILVACVAQLYSTLTPSIWTGFKVQPAQFLYYGLFYFLGWKLYINRTLLTYFDSHFRGLLLIGCAMSVVHVLVINLFFQASIASGIYAVLFKITFSAQTVFLAIGAIGLFNRLFNKPSPVSVYLSDSAYWVYLVHLPLVLVLQLYFLDSLVPGWLKFPLVILITAFVAFISYHFVVRNRSIGVLLNGKRKQV